MHLWAVSEDSPHEGEVRPVAHLHRFWWSQVVERLQVSQPQNCLIHFAPAARQYRYFPRSRPVATSFIENVPICKTYLLACSRLGSRVWSSCGFSQDSSESNGTSFFDLLFVDPTQSAVFCLPSMCSSTFELEFFVAVLIVPSAFSWSRRFERIRTVNPLQVLGLELATS